MIPRWHDQTAQMFSLWIYESLCNSQGKASLCPVQVRVAAGPFSPPIQMSAVPTGRRRTTDSHRYTRINKKTSPFLPHRKISVNPCPSVVHSFGCRPCRLGGDGDVADGGGRFRNGESVFFQTEDVERDGLPQTAKGLGPGSAGGDTPGQIGTVPRKVFPGLLNHHGIFHFFNSFSPACLRTLFAVPLARSSPGFPAMVTLPFFVGCLYCW